MSKSEQEDNARSAAERTDDNGDQAGAGADKPAGNPVKEMFLLAALYLPLGFFLWFFFASALMFPTARLADILLSGTFPDIFDRIVQIGFNLEIQTLITLAQPVEGRTVALNLHVNPMIYAWGMALLFGLIMATPLTARRRFAQILIGFVIVTLVTVWGVYWEAWVSLAFSSGPEAAALARESVLPLNAIALCYQLGYLMFPAVIPVATWILLNRTFIEDLVLKREDVSE